MDKVSVGLPERAGQPVTVAVGTQISSRASYEASLLAEKLWEAAAVARDQEREAIDSMAAEIAANAPAHDQSPSTGYNSPKFVQTGEFLMLEWRDDQGRRVRRFIATFHEQAGEENGWGRKVLAGVVQSLGESGFIPSVRDRPSIQEVES